MSGKALTGCAAIVVGLGIAFPVGAQCDNPDPTPTCPGQLGLQGAFEQFWDGGAGCFDDPNTAPPCDGWVGIALPYNTGIGTPLTSAALTLGSNLAGGDLAVLAGTTDGGGICKPDATSVLAVVPFALEGKSAGGQVQIDFATAADPLVTITQETWLVLIPRSGRAGVNGLGYPDGTIFPGHQVGRDSGQPSAPNIVFLNLSGTSGLLDWTDAHNFALGTPMCADLIFDAGVVAVTTGDPTAFDGACCDTSPGCTVVAGYECGVAAGLFQGFGSSCPNSQCTCGAGAGDCLTANGTPGCEVLACCKVVCDTDPFCCDTAWDAACVIAAANNVAACVIDLAPGGGVPLATGPDPLANGYLRVSPDVYGSYQSVAFGGLGDEYNPGPPAAAGPDPPPAEATFTAGFFLFYDFDGDGTNDHRELLSHGTDWQAVFPADDTLARQVLDPMVAVDTNGDLVDDFATSAFRVRDPDGTLDLRFDVTHEVVNVCKAISDYVLTYEITNLGPVPESFVLVRANDLDLVWDNLGDFTDDSVGTNTNDGPGLDRHVFQSEAATPNTAITVHSADAGVYSGSKGGIVPDAGDPDCVAYGYGTDTELWDAFGITGGDGTTDCWANFIPGVGYDTDGESGDLQGDPACDPCDAMIMLEIPVTVAPGEVALSARSITTKHGANTPGAAGLTGCDDCPWDCEPLPSGTVGTADLLSLLAGWGLPGPCDFDGGGAGTSDLLKLLANWGGCG